MNHGLLPILVAEVFLYEIGNNTILKQTDTLLFMTVTNRHSKNKVIIMATSSLLWPIYWCRAGKFTLWKHNKWNIFQAIPRQLKNQRIYLPNPLAVNLISLSQISFPTLMFFFPTTHKIPGNNCHLQITSLIIPIRKRQTLYISYLAHWKKIFPASLTSKKQNMCDTLRTFQLVFLFCSLCHVFIVNALVQVTTEKFRETVENNKYVIVLFCKFYQFLSPVRSHTEVRLNLTPWGWVRN